MAGCKEEMRMRSLTFACESTRTYAGELAEALRILAARYGRLGSTEMEAGRVDGCAVEIHKQSSTHAAKA